MRWTSDVQAYFNSIPRHRILSRAEAAALSGEIAEGVRGFRHAMARIPGTAQRIVEIWLQRVDRGLVTGMMCHRARDDRKTDWTGHIDRTVAEIRAHLSAGESPAKLAAGVEKADILFELLEEIHLEFALLVEDRSRGSVALQRSRGLRTAAGRRALEQAARSLEARNRARQEFASCNLRLVIARAKRMRGMGVRFEDLIQEGNLGLLRAIDKYEPERGFRFSTYAVWWIDQSVIRAIQNDSRTVRVPSHLYDRLREMRRVEERLRLGVGDSPARHLLAGELGIELAELDELAATGAPIRSVDEPISEEGELALVDLLSDEQQEAPEDELHRRRIQKVVSASLPSLGPRERKVLELRYGLRGTPPMSLREIGKELGLSGERVRQIEVSALADLGGREEIASLGPRSSAA